MAAPATPASHAWCPPTKKAKRRNEIMWRALAEHFKHCTRHGGGVFLLGLLGAPACAAVVSSLGEWAGPVLWTVWLMFFGFGLTRFIHQWRHPVRLGKLPPLSRHDLQAARSKLLNHRHRA